jgi:hypothetical protein
MNQMDSDILGIWLTDTHMNFLSNGVKRKFLKKIAASGKSLFITGDISDYDRLEKNLRELSKACKGSVYFVTGNHDSYHGSWAQLDVLLRRATRDYPNLVYLPHVGIVKLNEDTCVIGPEGWYDGRLTDMRNDFMTPMGMNDFNYIDELKWDSRSAVIEAFEARADAGLVQLKALCEAAVKRYKNVIILSHPAPFERILKWRSELAPFYVWYNAGQYIGSFAAEHPDTHFLWLSGHTHEDADIDILPNLRCCSQSAVYRLPGFKKAIDVALDVVNIKEE